MQFVVRGKLPHKNSMNDSCDLLNHKDVSPQALLCRIFHTAKCVSFSGVSWFL